MASLECGEQTLMGDGREHLRLVNEGNPSCPGCTTKTTNATTNEKGQKGKPFLDVVGLKDKSKEGP